MNFKDIDLFFNYLDELSKRFNSQEEMHRLKRNALKQIVASGKTEILRLYFKQIRRTIDSKNEIQRQQLLNLLLDDTQEGKEDGHYLLDKIFQTGDTKLLQTYITRVRQTLNFKENKERLRYLNMWFHPNSEVKNNLNLRQREYQKRYVDLLLSVNVSGQRHLNVLNFLENSDLLGSYLKEITDNLDFNDKEDQLRFFDLIFKLNQAGYNLLQTIIFKSNSDILKKFLNHIHENLTPVMQEKFVTSLTNSLDYNYNS